jgi:hypothetical protein
MTTSAPAVPDTSGVVVAIDSSESLVNKFIILTFAWSKYMIGPLFLIWMLVGVMGAFIWLIHVDIARDQNRAIRRWSLFTVLWPVGLVVVFAYGIKLTVE